MILPAISNNIRHIGMKKYWYLQVLGHFPCIFESEIDRIDIFRYKLRGRRPKIDVLENNLYKIIENLNWSLNRWNFENKFIGVFLWLYQFNFLLPLELSRDILN